ncbi:protein phosphatase 2C domain-containing protein, partial [bacterium]|nr:protein phosphatase 2C domain-containing protein [bacterium]
PTSEEAPASSEDTPSPASILREVSLPNGKDGEEYRIDHLKEKFFGPAAQDVSHYYLAGLDETGISLREDEDTLVGTPALVDNEPRNIEVTLFYHLTSQPRAKPFQHVLRFNINPNPRKLWKDLPSNPTAPFWKLDQDCSRISEPGEGELIGASLRGRGHAHDGKCRDDDYFIKYFHQSGWWVSIVADGAGSAKYSREGARIACTEGGKLFEKSLHHLEVDSFSKAMVGLSSESDDARAKISKILGNIFTREISYEVFRMIHDQAKLSDHRIKDFHTTFLISAWKQTPSGWFIGAFAIGDGGMAVTHGDEVTPLSKGDEGEFSGETVFLTSQDVWKDSEALRNRVKFGLFSDVKGIYAMTDGITDSKFETDHNFSQPSKWTEFVSDLDAEIGTSDNRHELLLEWMEFWSLGNHDDRTMTIFTPAVQATE